MSEILRDVLLALAAVGGLLLLGLMWGSGGGGVGKNPPLSPEARQKMREFLDKEKPR